MAWFKKARKPIEPPDKQSRVPEGLWVKCPGLRAGHLQQGSRGQPERLPEVRAPLPAQRRRAAADAVRRRRGWSTTADLASTDPLSSPTPSRTASGSRPSIEATGLKDAVITRDRARSTASRPSSRRWSTASSAAAWASSSARRSPAAIERGDRAAAAGRHRLLLGRRADDGRRAVADADGEDQRRARAARRARGCRTSRCSPIRRPAASRRASRCSAT